MKTKKLIPKKTKVKGGTSWQRKKGKKVMAVSKRLGIKKTKPLEEKPLEVGPVEFEPLPESIDAVSGIQVPLEGPFCDCGNPVAPGQTAVCKDHIRTN